ncbi:hypothetical protein Tco_1271457 [Tanacetum coccineum]
MSMTKEQQQSLDDALVPREQCPTIGSCNYRFCTTFKPKEPIFQVAFDILTLTPFYSAFLITASVPAIYMQEFWATVTYQKHHIRLKMKKKSYSFDMETFRNMLLIYPKLPGQKFVDPPFEEEILTFIRELSYPGNIKLLSEVKVDTLPQPWRTFGTIINKCLSGKVTRIDTLCLSRAQILWGLYHQEKVDYSYLLWEDLVFQIENKEYGAILPDYLTNLAMKESKASKTYHDLATGKVQPKPKYVRRSSRTKTDKAPKPSSSKRVKATAKSSEKEDDAEENVSEHEDDDDDERTESDNDGDDFVHPKFSTHDDEAKQDEEGDMINEEETHKEVEANVLYRDVNVNLEGRDNLMTDVPLPNVQATQETEDTHVILTAPINPEGIDSIFNLNMEVTSLVDVSVTTIAEPPLVFATTLPPPPTPLTYMQQTPVPTPTIGPSSSLQNHPNFGSLFGLRDEAQAKNEDFLNKLDENIKKIIKDQVKEQVNAQVSKILPRIKKTVNKQLEAEVMTRSTTKSKTSLAIAANLSELEMKKILIEKMESNKLIYRFNEQKNLYKALVEAYESDKLILDTYGDTVLFKRCRDDEDRDEEPFVGSNRGSKRRRAGKEPESTKTSQHPDWFQKPAKILTPDRDWNKTLLAVHGPVQPWLSNLAQEEGPRESFDELMDTPLDFSAFIMNRLKIDTLTPKLLAGPTFELMKGTCKSLVELEYFFKEVDKATTNQLDWHNLEGQQYPHDLRKPLLLISYSRGRQVIPFDHFINNDLAYLSGGVSSRTYATSITKSKAADYGHIKWIEDLVPNTIWSEVSVNYDKNALWGIYHWGRKRQQFYGFAASREFAHDVYSKRKLTNLNVDGRLTFGVSLRMFTRSIVIQRRVEDLQLGVESYQKNLNITKPDTYRSGLKHRDDYTAYTNPKGFIYQNKDKKNKLMRTDELHKFSDGTLDDVRTALNDHLKGIRIEYLPKTIWR